MTKKCCNEKIQNLRSHLGLSLAAFGECIEITPTHVSNLEKGTVAVSEGMIDRICTAFHVEHAYFEGTKELADALTPSTQNAETGRRLKEARERRGWTQKEMAEATGVAQAVISRLESGAKLTEKMGRRLAEALEIGLDCLMVGEERNKCFPADRKMIEWLKNHESVRQEIWERMKNSPD